MLLNNGEILLRRMDSRMRENDKDGRMVVYMAQISCIFLKIHLKTKSNIKISFDFW